MKPGQVVTVPTRKGNRRAVIKAVRGDSIIVTWLNRRDNSHRESQPVLYKMTDVIAE